MDLITSREAFYQYFTTHNTLIKKAIKRGLQFRIILDIDELDRSVLSILKAYETSNTPLNVKYAKPPLIHCTITDYKEALVATSQEATIGRHPYLWTNDHNLTEILQKNFERIWHTATKIQIRRMEKARR